MIALDTNLLVYAHRRDSPFHASAAACVQDLAEGHTDWAVPWPVLYEFYAVVTHPRLYRPPSTPEQALEQVAAWLGSPSVRPLGEESTTWKTFAQAARSGRVTGPLAYDARIAALCRCHKVQELWTVDRDFSRFAGLTTKNPLVSAT